MHVHARKLMLAGAVAAIAAPAAWSQQTSEEAATAQRETAAAAAVEAQVQQAQAQAAQAQLDQAEARAQVAQAEAQVRSAEREMAAARVQLERAAREVAIQTRRAAVTVDENGLVRFNGGPGTSWAYFSGQGMLAHMGAELTAADGGALVTGITPESGAADAGLQVGDVIRSIDGVDLAEADGRPAVAVLNRLAAIEPGATVELVVERDGTERSIDVVTQEGTSPLVVTTENGRVFFRRAERITPNGESFAAGSAAAAGRGAPVAVTVNDALNTIRLFNLTGAPWGDMELVPITPELGRYFETTEGLLVVRAPSDETVGLQDGDVILSIGGRAPTSAAHAIRILGSFEAGEVIEFSLMRDGRSQPLEYTVEESGFQYFSPVTIGVPPATAPAAPAAPGGRARGPAPAPATPATAEPVSPTSL